MDLTIILNRIRTNPSPVRVWLTESGPQFADDYPSITENWWPVGTYSAIGFDEVSLREDLALTMAEASKV